MQLSKPQNTRTCSSAQLSQVSQQQPECCWVVVQEDPSSCIMPQQVAVGRVKQQAQQAALHLRSRHIHTESTQADSKSDEASEEEYGIYQHGSVQHTRAGAELDAGK